MGLPEIVDVARTFAVMVRVQGPDPKGLKMRNHAFHNYSSGKTTLSASGMLLPSSFHDPAVAKQVLGDNYTSLLGSVLVLTVASVIEPFLSLQHRQNISQAKHELVTGSQIDIMVEGRSAIEHGINLSDKEAPKWLSAKVLTLVEIPVASLVIQSLIEGSTGALEHGWEVGWSLASYSNSPKPLMDNVQQQVQRSSMPSMGQMLGEASRNPSLMGKSTTRIAILGVSSTLLKDLPNLSISPPNKKGDLLLAMGSPFGVLSPVHFFNSVSVGSIANCYPAASSNKSLLMGDIRCLPGMEGSPVFGKHAQLIGMLTRPLRQRTSGAEIQLLIPWEAIATSCSNLFQKEPNHVGKWSQVNNEHLNAVGKTPQSSYLESFNHVDENACARCNPPSPIEIAMASICLITVNDGAWASGVLLNKQGLILTNAHLLEPWRFRKAAAGENTGSKSEVIFTPPNSAPLKNGKFGGHPKSWELLSTNKNRSIRVRLDNTDPWTWVDASVLYVSQGPLDIALLQLDFVPEQLCPIDMDFSYPCTGSTAYVIGHGLFGPRCDFFPSACLGVVAKVVEARGPVAHQSGELENGLIQIPAMIETTAAVHPGGSGGAVVNSVGHMIGLVTSNARHGGGMVIPHLNFSIPCAALEPIFKFSKDMQNLSILKDLDKPNELLSSVWALIPPLSPKPGPSLLNLPLFPPGDNTKDIKGSQFAKFIAERHELIKKTTTQSGEVESPSAKVISSKL